MCRCAERRQLIGNLAHALSGRDRTEVRAQVAALGRSLARDAAELARRIKGRR